MKKTVGILYLIGTFLTMCFILAGMSADVLNIELDFLKLICVSFMWPLIFGAYFFTLFMN